MKRLKWYDHLSINLFWLGLNIRNTALGSVFMPYLVDIFVRPEVKNTALGAMRTAGLVIAMLVQPAAGLLSDRSTSRFGRRRPYIFAGALLDLVFLVAVGLSGSYWALFIAVLLLQTSSNVSHGPLQGLIPDLVPEDQRGRASAVKSIFELIPLILVALTVAKLVAAGQMGWAIAATCGGVILTMVLTMLLVHEEPLKEKPAGSIQEPMLRVAGMLAGIAVGALAGLVGGGVLGGLAGLITLPLGGEANAWKVGVGLGGVVAMAVAVVVGVWAGALLSLGKSQGALVLGLRAGGLAGVVALPIALYARPGGVLASILGTIWLAVTVGSFVAFLAELNAFRAQAVALRRTSVSFIWWIINRLMFLAAATSIQTFAPYFLMSAFGVSREAAIDLNASLMMVVGVFTLVSALPGGWLADRVGSKQLVGASGLVALGGTLVLLVTTFIPNLPLMYVAGIIIGLGAGLFMTTNWALGTELAPPNEAGRYLGISNLAGAGAGMIGGGIGGPVADLINRYQPGLGYFVIFACYAVLFLLSTLTLVRVRKGA